MAAIACATQLDWPAKRNLLPSCRLSVCAAATSRTEDGQLLAQEAAAASNQCHLAYNLTNSAARNVRKRTGLCFFFARRVERFLSPATFANACSAGQPPSLFFLSLLNPEEGVFGRRGAVLQPPETIRSASAGEPIGRERATLPRPPQLRQLSRWKSSARSAPTSDETLAAINAPVACKLQQPKPQRNATLRLDKQQVAPERKTRWETKTRVPFSPLHLSCLLLTSAGIAQHSFVGGVAKRCAKWSKATVCERRTCKFVPHLIRCAKSCANQ